MTFNNRAADARLGRIEKALQTAENRLDAEVHAGNEGGNLTNPLILSEAL